MSYAIFELKCPACGIEYAQILHEDEEKVSISCPSCSGSLEKGKKLSGTDMLSCGCGISAGSG
ncbi:hypothetical protein BMS3Abin14_00247 [bacterium BMS3Abin14]|nr:hypothetical protein BMS3Abin14_00247 [bacterium BMS3Abin14]